jgi:hypothetical protein
LPFQHQYGDAANEGEAPVVRCRAGTVLLRENGYVEQLQSSGRLDPDLADVERGRGRAVEIGRDQFIDELFENDAGVGPGERPVRLDCVGKRGPDWRRERDPLERALSPADPPAAEAAESCRSNMVYRRRGERPP